MASEDGDWELYANWDEYMSILADMERCEEERCAIEEDRRCMREEMGRWFMPEYEMFEEYLRSEASTVAFAVRHSRCCPWARDRWLDVIDVECDSRDVSHARGVQRYWAYDDDEYADEDNSIMAIERACVELFPRRTKPRFVSGMGMVNLYNAWRASIKDIRAARKRGYRGQRWSVRLELVDSTKDQCVEKVLKPRWSEVDGMWVDALGYLSGSHPCDVHVLEGPDPVWCYRVASSERAL